MRQFTKIEKEAPIDFENFRIHMQREMILRKLKEGGYRITKQRPAEGRVITVMLEDGGKLHLDAAEWNRVLQTGLRDCGYLKDERVLSVKNVYKTDAI